MYPYFVPPTISFLKSGAKVQQGLSVTFADKGIGMTPTEYRKLFRMFYRGSNHAEGGHGIGMALVQRIMVLHNARIDVQSKEGHGTKFILRLHMTTAS